VWRFDSLCLLIWQVHGRQGLSLNTLDRICLTLFGLCVLQGRQTFFSRARIIGLGSMIYFQMFVMVGCNLERCRQCCMDGAALTGPSNQSPSVASIGNNWLLRMHAVLTQSIFHLCDPRRRCVQFWSIPTWFYKVMFQQLLA
jgi:hypothetical protein